MVYDESDKYSPDFWPIIYRRAILAFSKKDSVLANKYIARYVAIRKGNSENEADINSDLGDLYAECGMPDKAEVFYCKAIAQEPDKTGRLVTLTDFFIEQNRKLDEVSEIMDKAMKMAKNKVDYYNYLNTKGWALYKQGKTKESLDILQKCWDETPYKLYSIKSHYEEVKKAVAIQK
jgi:tetratricopeptide (TPR) repeat protein